MALSGHSVHPAACPLLGVKRTSLRHVSNENVPISLLTASRLTSARLAYRRHPNPLVALIVDGDAAHGTKMKYVLMFLIATMAANS